MSLKNAVVNEISPGHLIASTHITDGAILIALPNIYFSLDHSTFRLLEIDAIFDLYPTHCSGIAKSSKFESLG